MIRSGSRDASSAQSSHGDNPSRKRSVSGNGIATSMSVSECSKTISWMSAGVQSLRYCSAESFGSVSGVSTWWNA